METIVETIVNTDTTNATIISKPARRIFSKCEELSNYISTWISWNPEQQVFYNHFTNRILNFTPQKRCGYLNTQLYVDGAKYVIGKHVLMWAVHHGGQIVDCQIDHIDGNSRNNDISNLRELSQRQNLLARRNRNTKWIGYWFNQKTGIYYTKCILENKKYHYIGRYKSEIDAAQAFRNWVETTNKLSLEDKIIFLNHPQIWK